MQTGSPTLYYVIVPIIIIIIIAIVVAMSRRGSSSAHLRQRFGPEYDRTVAERGDRAVAERELAGRETRVKGFHLEDLPAGARSRYTDEWRAVQSRFVDEPKTAIGEADGLVSNVMRDRGYPVENFEQQAADISPDHPGLVENYRSAHAIAANSARGDVSTEDLRQAMVHYRELFNDLLGTDERTTS